MKLIRKSNRAIRKTVVSRVAVDSSEQSEPIIEGGETSLKESAATPVVVANSQPVDRQALIKLLKRRHGATMEFMRNRLKASDMDIIEAMAKLQENHYNIQALDDIFFIPKFVPDSGTHQQFQSADGIFRIGCISDTHLGSTSCRMDIVHEVMDWFEDEEIDFCLHAGNWIEGIKYGYDELEAGCSTAEGQVQYFIEHWPRKPFDMYFIAGDDHEGWFQQQLGLDIGQTLEDRAKNNRQVEPRHDLHYLGYKRAYVDLFHADAEEGSTPCDILVDHPGGGSAAALSHKVQREIDKMLPGEIPKMLIAGHLHSMCHVHHRDVHAFVLPGTKDKDLFHDKFKLQPYMGGLIIEVELDEFNDIQSLNTSWKTQLSGSKRNFVYDV